MPTYDYRCDTCGVFAALRRISERDAASPCPSCGKLAQRTLSVPALSLMASTQRVAHQTNERASHAPHRHGPGCGCSSKPKLATSSPAGLKGNGGGRPWMISH
ncbi:zinc ribbon domain-containing protein [Paraburkholderia xenovorans]|uniref:FmdB family zinc ribbon protein n=1 Tax=Paraburkholderia xenovorans TaxID=36873 RepID=UPI0038BBD51B